jgi:Vacuolar protein sorting-associated protein 62
MQMPIANLNRPKLSWTVSMILCVLLVFLALGCLSVAFAQSAGDEDGDGISDELEDELMGRFAPVVKLHPEEEYFPANVDWMLPLVGLQFYTCFQGEDSIPALEPGQIDPNSPDSINSMLGQCQKCQCGEIACGYSSDALQCSGPEHGLANDPRQIVDKDPTHFFLNFPEERLILQGLLDSTLWTCYTHVMRSPAHHPYMYDIQYFFFYPFSGPLAGWGEHEGDWEHVTVRVKSDLHTIYGVYYSAHEGEGRWYQQETGPESGYKLTEDGRPIVYSAYHSHASYPWAGNWDRDPNGLPDDNTADGFEWNCRNNIVNLGEKLNPHRDMKWNLFTGNWGDCQSEIYGEVCGPTGPSMRSFWTVGDPLNGDNPYDYGWRYVNQANVESKERGTWEDPFRNFSDAIANVPSGGNIVILYGTYSAIGTYSKPMTLYAPEGTIVLGD